MGNLNDFYIHPEEICHIWNNGYSEALGNQSGYHNILIHFIGNLRLSLYFLKQMIDNISQAR